MDAGLNPWDTACAYGMGASEEVLGGFLKGLPREIGEPWLNRDGPKQSWQHPGGHFACVWRHGDGLFYMKDPSDPASWHNDVPYTHERMELWLVGAFENCYVILAAGEARP